MGRAVPKCRSKKPLSGSSLGSSPVGSSAGSLSSVPSTGSKAAWSEASGWIRSSKDAWFHAEAAWAEASKVTPETRSKRLFQRYSTEHRDRLSIEEVARLLTDLNGGYPVHLDVARYMMSAAKHGGDENTVDEGELQGILHRWKATSEKVREAEPMMNKYDKEHKGYLTRSEVASLLKGLNKGRSVSSQDVDWVFNEADLSGDGLITMSELPRVISFWSARKSRRNTNQGMCAMQ
uniref:EF-hand domain-containing protein n=1 Tax=Pyrodinium bahamense TaxID=73915 RepID=A0A7R9ZVM3_9DINO